MTLIQNRSSPGGHTRGSPKACKRGNLAQPDCKVQTQHRSADELPCRSQCVHSTTCARQHGQTEEPRIETKLAKTLESSSCQRTEDTEESGLQEAQQSDSPRIQGRTAASGWAENGALCDLPGRGGRKDKGHIQQLQAWADNDNDLDRPGADDTFVLGIVAGQLLN